jgi:hypothetical protein
MDKILVLLLIALAFTVSIFGAILYYAPGLEEDSAPLVPYREPPVRSGPVPQPYNVTFSSEEIEVVQGESSSIKMYITSLGVYTTDETAKFSWNLYTYQGESWDSSKPVPLEIIFNPNQLISNYREPETIILTIKSAKEAPLGEYRVSLDVSISSVEHSFGAHNSLLITVIP